MNGKVKFYDSSKGFGFIIDNESGNEYFVHATQLVDRIQENDQVEFESTQGKRSEMAINVKVIY